MSRAPKKIRGLKDLVPDDKNANRGTERGREMIGESLRRFGAGRSVLVDRKGKLIAGNKTVENAAAAGLKNVIVVPTDGTQLVVVQRTDLDMDADPRAREMAVADNRSAEVNLEWDEEALAQLREEGCELEEFFNEEEMEGILSKLEEAAGPLPPRGSNGFNYTEKFGVIVICADEAEQKKVYEKLTKGGYTCRVVVA